jgi:GNAT superfamily N-acetyltransferase
MAEKPSPTIREVLHSADPAVAKGHGLVWRTFHKSESVGRGEWLNSLREREAGLWTDLRWHLVVAELAGAVIGVATGTYLGNVNTGVIGYLAVSRAARGSGVGPRLRARLRTLFRRDARKLAGEPLRGIIGEIRPDNPWLQTLIRRDHVLALDFAYLQPRLRPGARSVPLVMYYEAIDRVIHRLPAALIRKLLYTLWRRIYRIAQPLSHAAFRKMLGELEGRRSIGALRPEQIAVRA